LGTNFAEDVPTVIKLSAAICPPTYHALGVMPCRRNSHRILQIVLQHLGALVCILFGINNWSTEMPSGVRSCMRVTARVSISKSGAVRIVIERRFKPCAPQNMHITKTGCHRLRIPGCVRDNNPYFPSKLRTVS
jgi:hypothetical protein